jgi:hypothetical protein
MLYFSNIVRANLSYTFGASVKMIGSIPDRIIQLGTAITSEQQVRR